MAKEYHIRSRVEKVNGTVTVNYSHRDTEISGFENYIHGSVNISVNDSDPMSDVRTSAENAVRSALGLAPL